MFLLLHLLIPLTGALSPGDTFPSCLQAGVTWAQTGVYSVSLQLPSPESCQQLCAEDSFCRGFTWLTATAPLLNLSCSLFDQTDTETGCEHCVSGPAEPCACRLQGECEVQEGNLIDSRDGVRSVTECEQICAEEESCGFYTYLGEGNNFRYTCFLFSSCEAFVPNCTDCTTGLAECDVCNFEDTLPSGVCKGSCEKGWASFNDACYLIMNNHDYQYFDIVQCRESCSHHGSLGSIHSQEENDFVTGLLRPTGSHRGSQATWIGGNLVSEYPEYVFDWEDSTPWDYNNWWIDVYPPSIPMLPCVSMGMDPNHPGKWESVDCESKSSNWDCLCKTHDSSLVK